MTSTGVLLEHRVKAAETPVIAPVKEGVGILTGILFILGIVAMSTPLLVTINSLVNKLLGR